MQERKSPTFEESLDDSHVTILGFSTLILAALCALNTVIGYVDSQANVNKDMPQVVHAQEDLRPGFYLQAK